MMFESGIHVEQPGRTVFNHRCYTWRGWVGYRVFFEHEKTLPHFETIIARIIARFFEDVSIIDHGCKPKKQGNFDKAIQVFTSLFANFFATHHISSKWFLPSDTQFLKIR